MPAWPSTLPRKPLSASYQATAQNNIIRSEVDAGTAKQRRRFTATSTLHACAYILSKTQRDALLTFYNVDVAAAERFDWPHPETGATVFARFIGPLQITPLAGARYGVQIAIEQLP